MVKADLDKLNQLVEQKYLSVQKHPTADLFIYNYTQRAQFERFWTEETMMCRGLIVDSLGNIIARPFKKFFNLGEYTGEDSKLPVLPVEEFEVFDKWDGSLGILYPAGGRPHLATRGSFTSEQAIKGTDILRRKYGAFQFNPEYTYLYEIIYPSNRIVVNYGETEDIVLLAVINTETGEERPYPFIDESLGFTVATRYDGLDDLSVITKLQKDNKEGFVIRFKNSGIRVKIKFDEYVRLHRLVTGVNKKTIWELLRNKQPFEELIERVPDEFMQWVKDTKAELEGGYQEIEEDAKVAMAKIVADLDRKFKSSLTDYQTDLRKEFATRAIHSPYVKLLFMMLDKKDYEDAIWKIIRPVAEKPYKEHDEAIA